VAEECCPAVKLPTKYIHPWPRRGVSTRRNPPILTSRCWFSEEPAESHATVHVTDERGRDALFLDGIYVQDLLYAILRPWVADITPEEFTPNYSGSKHSNGFSFREDCQRANHRYRPLPEASGCETLRTWRGRSQRKMRPLT